MHSGLRFLRVKRERKAQPKSQDLLFLPKKKKKKPIIYGNLMLLQPHVRP